MSRTHRILWVCVLAGLLAVPQTRSTATDIPEDWLIDNQRWTEPTTGAELIEVRNFHGDVRIRPADEEEIFLSAMIQRHVDDPLRAEIDTTREDATFRVEVRYPDVGDFDPAEHPEAWSKRRVDLTVYVPAKRPLTVETLRGLVEIKGLNHGITARSTSGDIVLATAGHATAKTERGSITARFADTDWESAVELETLTGSIAVTLPPSADVTATLATSGELTTDFSLTVEHPAESQHKTASARIGKGSSELSITSKRGSLKLLRAPF